MVIAAFFDFDNTLLRRDSAEIGIKYLWDRGKIPTTLMIKILVALPFYKANLMPIEWMTDLVITLYRGHRLADFEEGVGEFYYQELKPHLSSNVVTKLQEHKAAGHLVVLLSASVRYMLLKVVEDLDFDHLLCTNLEVDPHGLLTGRPEGHICLGPHKAVAASHLAEELQIDLASSYAYGDHYSDLAILELVGNPVAVQPDSKLRKIVQQRGWPVIQH